MPSPPWLTMAGGERARTALVTVSRSRSRARGCRRTCRSGAHCRVPAVKDPPPPDHVEVAQQPLVERYRPEPLADRLCYAGERELARDVLAHGVEVGLP